jgi:hypothetical protein
VSLSMRGGLDRGVGIVGEGVLEPGCGCRVDTTADVDEDLLVLGLWEGPVERLLGDHDVGEQRIGLRQAVGGPDHKPATVAGRGLERDRAADLEVVIAGVV